MRDRFSRHGHGRPGTHPESRPGRTRGEHGPRGGRRMGGRVFDHGELRYVVLALIEESPRHGYEIIKAIEERLAGSYSPSPGVIYPTLTLLEELGYTTVTEGDGKKLYSITAAGQEFLAANRATVDAALTRMKEISARHGNGPAPQIIRAMENLKLALRLRLEAGPLGNPQLQTISEAIDAAAIAVERS